MAMNRHVTAERLLAWLDGAWDREAEMHIKSCVMCAREVADARLLRCLLKWKPGRTAVPHIDDERFAAYAEEALSPEEMQEVSAHLERCDRCLLDFIDLRYAMRAAEIEEDAPSPHAAVAERLEAIIRQWVGHVRIRMEQGVPQVRWSPTPWARAGLPAAAGGLSADSGESDWAPHSPTAVHEPAFRFQVREGSGARAADAVIEAGPYRVEVTVIAERERLEARLHVSASDDDAPVSMLPITLTLENGDTVTTQTDDAGYAELLIGARGGDIELGDDPSWRITFSTDRARR